MRKVIKTMLEKDKTRGLVPARSFGIQDRVYGAYLDKLNIRNNDEVQEALAGSKDPRFLEFLERVSIPKYRSVSLQSIAKGCQISLREFQEWWQRESSQQAIALAQTSSMPVIADMAQDALSKDACCDRCDGLGWVAAPEGLPKDTPGYKLLQGGKDPKWSRTCPAGCVNGKVRRPGDTHSRNTLLEIGGLINKKGGASVNINFGSSINHSSALADLSDKMTIDV